MSSSRIQLYTMCAECLWKIQMKKHFFLNCEWHHCLLNYGRFFILSFSFQATLLLCTTGQQQSFVFCREINGWTLIHSTKKGTYSYQKNGISCGRTKRRVNAHGPLLEFLTFSIWAAFHFIFFSLFVSPTVSMVCPDKRVWTTTNCLYVCQEHGVQTSMKHLSMNRKESVDGNTFLSNQPLLWSTLWLGYALMFYLRTWPALYATRVLNLYKCDFLADYIRLASSHSIPFSCKS
jgi:hypothetical protein